MANKQAHMNKGMVSIIMPSYNSANYINETISSVLEQTYTHWELIIVDDFSTDNTFEIIKDLSKRDQRIKPFKLKKNSGAAVARNNAVEQAEGEFLAFLDSDDLWLPEKLEKQISFMKMNNYDFTATAYNEIFEESGETRRTVLPKKESDYDGVLKHCPGNSTVMYNVDSLGKFFIPDIKRRNDFVMWLKVIKKANLLHGMDEVLTMYKVRDGSLSNNKKSLVKYQWKVYREIEKLSLTKSIYLLLYKIAEVILVNFKTTNLRK